MEELLSLIRECERRDAPKVHDLDAKLKDSQLQNIGFHSYYIGITDSFLAQIDPQGRKFDGSICFGVTMLHVYPAHVHFC